MKGVNLMPGFDSYRWPWPVPVRIFVAIVIVVVILALVGYFGGFI
jgi:hypothetical protein